MKKNRIFIGFLCMLFAQLFVITNFEIAAQQKIQSADRDSVISAAKEIISHVKYCALVTVDSSGTANVRTMNPFLPEEDMSVWMATKIHTRKYEEIKKNQKVTLYYANHAAVEGYVTITGRAELIDDMAEKQKRKRDYWDQAFPDWKELILIKIIPDRLEVINYKRGMNNGQSINWLAPFVDFKKP